MSPDSAFVPVAPETGAAQLKEAAPSARALQIANKPWPGDFDAMLERRMIRVAVPYRRTQCFVDQGSERGLAAELIRDFERWVDKEHAGKLGERPLTVHIVAATRNRLRPDLEAGLADIAVGNLTVTDERFAIVDYLAPESEAMNTEVLVTGPATPEIAGIDDLSGKTVRVRKTSSHHASLVALNERLCQAGKAEVESVLVPEAVEDEGILEMVNAGLLKAIVVDDRKARMWAQVLSKVTVREDVVLRVPTRKGWAVRKGSAQAWPRSGSLVQSCRGRDSREGRHGNDDLCAQHLQV